MSDPTLPASKRCTVCGEVKPLTEFNRLASRADGRRSECRACSRAHSRRHLTANREKIRDRQRQLRVENLDAVRARESRYRERNRERLRVAGRMWARENVARGVEYQRQRTAILKATVLAHYGTVCACCGTIDRLTIDHINGDGREHREEIFGNNKAAGRKMYLWLIKNAFPAGYQTLCARCNISKGRGKRCRINHRGRSPMGEVA